MRCIDCVHRKYDVCIKSGNKIASLTRDDECEYVSENHICPCGSNHTEFIKFGDSDVHEYIYFKCKSCGKRYEVLYMYGYRFVKYI